MARGKLFEFAVLYHPKPTKTQQDAGETPKSEVLIAPTQILASHEAQAATLVGRAIPETYIDKLDDIEVIIRPF